ncbi:hypothetical protein CYMTET_48976 [Cymbomonas tetramitiformis]|uniref:Uncharacterized protein n=1 Tax=Cymbomonas tetramitiformis TaxID=36881 RepID=A0AAE0EW83_9CHLO|nr:hypothetical protein CYMTET_48976 [Cymbomonas tetramitiformis]
MAASSASCCCAELRPAAHHTAKAASSSGTMLWWAAAGDVSYCPWLQASAPRCCAELLLGFKLSGRTLWWVVVGSALRRATAANFSTSKAAHRTM